MRFSTIYYLDIDRKPLTLKERLLKTLHMLSFSHCKRITDGQGIAIKMSQEALSKPLVASRQNLNKALKEPEREGLPKVSYGSISLHGLEGINRQYGYQVNVNQPAPMNSVMVR